jgi:hypothetical protein
MDYKYHFPDYDDTPLMKDWPGESIWTDSSWKNDVCPCFMSDDIMKGYIVKVWSEYDDEEKREDDGAQYLVTLSNLEDTYIETLLYTNNMSDVEGLIKRLEHANRLKG